MKTVIIGGGLIGLGTALAIQRLLPGVQICICEKEPNVGVHQSTHNSGVLHAGLYYPPGSLKARLAVRGIRLMTAFARENSIPHEVCGKIVIATEPSEIPHLQELLRRGIANGLRGVAWMNSDEVLEREPNVRSIAAVHVPEEGIIDYSRVVDVMRARIQAASGTVMCSARVTSARREGRAWRVLARPADLRADFVINCAGLHADRVARAFGASTSIQIVPFRGDYLALGRPQLIRNLVYPVPNPAFPFLGVHFTRMIGGGVECGPTAVLSLSREGYRPGSLSARDALESLAFPGLWKFMARYPNATWTELRRARSRPLLLNSLRRLVPSLTSDDLLPGGSGVRAQAMTASGELVQDFCFLEDEAILHVLNAPSPGATASLAIGEEIVRRIAARLQSRR